MRPYRRKHPHSFPVIRSLQANVISWRNSTSIYVAYDGDWRSQISAFSKQVALNNTTVKCWMVVLVYNFDQNKVNDVPDVHVAPLVGTATRHDQLAHISRMVYAQGTYDFF